MSPGAITDIVLVALLLIFVIIGFCRGFVKQIFGLLSSIIAFLVAYFLCAPLANMLNSTFGWTDSLANSISGIFTGNEIFTMKLSAQNIQTAITQAGLPQFVADIAVNSLGSVIADLSIAEYLSALMAKYIMIAGCYAVLWIVARLLLTVVKHILLKIVSLPVLNSINRILGLFVGLLEGVILVYVVIFIIGIIPNTSFLGVVQTGIAQSAFANFISGSGMGQWIVNLISKLIGKI